ncbi:MAG: hypothetical protein ACREBE_12625 [bacterium]
MRWYLGVGLEMEVLCVPCADLRQAGTAVTASRVCQDCFTHAIEDIANLVGIRGAPGVAERAAPFATTLMTTALPAELGRIADLAPLHDASGSTWLVLTASGALARFDAGTRAWSPIAECSVRAEPDHEPWCDHALRRRLHVSSRGDFAAVVNDYGRHGEVYDLRSGRVTMTLDGGDYHPETVPFSLAFFDARGRTVVIHRSDWNRLDLSDPASGKLLSARESPRYGEDRKQPPHYLDYFHGALVVDPSGTRVVDDGWIWHPVGVPVVFSLARWHTENVWESEDGPTRLDLCARNYYWDHAIAWLDDHRVVVAGIGDDDAEMIPGARIFDVTQRGNPSPGWSPHLPWARELLAFAGPSGQFFCEGGWLFSSSDTGLSRWDPTTGERTAQLAGFCPTHHHRAARELVQVVDRHLVRLTVEHGEDLTPRDDAR